MLKPISTEALQGLAENAAHLAKIIRQWLPVTGDTEAKTASWRTAERWFYQAAEHFTICERIRNPHKQPFNQRGGFYFGPSACSAAWSELESAIDGIAVAYRLQPVADESGIPHLPFEQDVPAIDAATLKRLELAASGILEAVRGERPGGAQAVKPATAAETPAIPVVRTFSEWQKAFDWSSSTWGRRRAEFPYCFTDVPGENACSIREPELSLWLASGANRNRSPFEKT